MLECHAVDKVEVGDGVGVLAVTDFLGGVRHALDKGRAAHGPAVDEDLEAAEKVEDVGEPLLRGVGWARHRNGDGPADIRELGRATKGGTAKSGHLGRVASGD